MIEPGERHPGAAASAVVLDHKPRTDTLHPHPAGAVAFGLEGKPAIVEEGDGVRRRSGGSDRYPGR